MLCAEGAPSALFYERGEDIIIHRKLPALAAAAALCLTLSSCSFIQPDTESLMHPPKLTALQTQIDEALKAALGTGDITLKYPISGDYRSAFVFHNLDADEQDEAIVFYQLEAGGKVTTRINLLDEQTDGSWASVFDVAGGGTDVHSIRFAPITSPVRDDIIITWNQAGKTSLTTTLYSYETRELTSLYSGTGDSVYTADVDGDGYWELFLLSKSGSRGPSIQLVRQEGRRVIVRSDELLNPKVTDFAAITFGKTATGEPALFIDEIIDADTTATEVVAIREKKPVNLMKAGPEGDETLFQSTYRRPGVHCRIGEDGVVEIPTQQLLPGYGESEEGEKLYLTTYHTMDSASLIPSTSAIINVEMGYTVDLPTTWRGNITVERVGESGEWRFLAYSSQGQSSGPELLRIRVTSHRDYQDRFETEQYLSLAKKGIFEYYGFIPQTDHPLAISEADLREMFTLNS